MPDEVQNNPDPAAAASGAPPPPAPVPPAGLENFWDEQANTLKVDDLAKSYGELSTLKSEHDARLAEVPAKPEEYKLEFQLPDDLKSKLPQGVEIKIDEKDPAVAELRAAAHELKLPQSTVSRLLSIEARRVAESQLRAADADAAWVNEQKAKLGEKANDRIAGVGAWVKQNVPAGLYEDALALTERASGVGLIEWFIAKANGGAIPGQTTAGSEPAVPTKSTAEILFPSMKKAS